MAGKQPPPAGGVAGVVKWFDADEGWGVIVAPEVPGDCFVHFSSIEAPGYRELRAGQQVRFTYEGTRLRARWLPIPRPAGLAAV